MRLPTLVNGPAPRPAVPPSLLDSLRVTINDATRKIQRVDDAAKNQLDAPGIDYAKEKRRKADAVRLYARLTDPNASPDALRATLRASGLAAPVPVPAAPPAPTSVDVANSLLAGDPSALTRPPRKAPVAKAPLRKDSIGEGYDRVVAGSKEKKPVVEWNGIKWNGDPFENLPFTMEAFQAALDSGRTTPIVGKDGKERSFGDAYRLVRTMTGLDSFKSSRVPRPIPAGVSRPVVPRWLLKTLEEQAEDARLKVQRVDDAAKNHFDAPGIDYAAQKARQTRAQGLLTLFRDPNASPEAIRAGLKAASVVDGKAPKGLKPYEYDLNGAYKSIQLSEKGPRFVPEETHLGALKKELARGFFGLVKGGLTPLKPGENVTDRGRWFIGAAGTVGRAVAGIPSAATKGAADTISARLGNGRIDPEIYEKDVPSRIASNVAAYGPYFVPGVNAVLSAAQAADLADQFAQDPMKAAAGLYEGMVPWKAKTPEEAAFRILGLVGGAKHLSGRTRGMIDAVRKGEKTTPMRVAEIVKSAYADGVAKGVVRSNRPKDKSVHSTGPTAPFLKKSRPSSNGPVGGSNPAPGNTPSTPGGAPANSNASPAAGHTTSSASNLPPATGKSASAHKPVVPETPFKLKDVPAGDPSDPVDFARKYIDIHNHPKNAHNSPVLQRASIEAPVSQIQLKLAEKHGVSLSNSSPRMLDSHAILHGEKKHGASSGAKHRGEAEVLPDDYAFLHDVMSNPDQVLYYEPKSKTAPVRFGLLRRINGHILYVEEARGKDAKLAMVSIRKWPAGSQPPEGFLHDYTDTFVTIRKPKSKGATNPPPSGSPPRPHDAFPSG
jgi:hypothetical protein